MHSIRIKITAVTLAAILTSLAAFIGISYFTMMQENDKTSVETLNLLSQNAQKTVDVRLNSLKRSVDVVADIAACGSRRGQSRRADARTGKTAGCVYAKIL